MKVYVEGQLQTRKWQDQQGQDRYTTEIVLQKFRGELQMLDARGQGEGGQVGYSGGGRDSSASPALLTAVVAAAPAVVSVAAATAVATVAAAVVRPANWMMKSRSDCYWPAFTAPPVG